MAKLRNTSVSGNLTIDNSLLSGTGIINGYQNMAIYTTGTAATFTFPAAFQSAGIRFKVTIVGGGGGGGGTRSTAGDKGGGGGGGGVCIAYLTMVSGVYTLTYTVGAGGTRGATLSAGVGGGTSSVVYNGVTYSASGGTGGPPPSTQGGGIGGTGTNGTLNIQGGNGGNSGTSAALYPVFGYGGLPALGFGAANFISIGGSYNYGAGGAGGLNTTLATAQTGLAGIAGLVIIEY
jgi:hypothetical protein